MLTYSNLENGEATPFTERKSCLGESARQRPDRVNTRSAGGCRRAKRRDPLTTIPHNRSSSNRFGPNQLTKQSVSITKPLEREARTRAPMHILYWTYVLRGRHHQVPRCTRREYVAKQRLDETSQLVGVRRRDSLTKTKLGF